MASVRDTVYHKLVSYPTLYQNASDCYRDLFLSNGTGVDWIDGELVSLIDDPKHPWMIPQFQDEMVEILKLNNSPAYGEYETIQVRLEVRRRNSQIQFAIDNVDLISDEPICFERLSDFTKSQYEPIFHIPANIKPDWLFAAKRTIYAILVYCNVNETRQFNYVNAREMMKQLSIDKMDNFLVKRIDLIEQILAKLDKHT